MRPERRSDEIAFFIAVKLEIFLETEEIDLFIDVMWSMNSFCALSEGSGMGNDFSCVLLIEARFVVCFAQPRKYFLLYDVFNSKDRNSGTSRSEHLTANT